MTSKSPFANVVSFILAISFILQTATGTALILTLKELSSTRRELDDLTKYNSKLQKEYDETEALNQWQKRHIRWMECRGEFREQPGEPTLVE